MMLRAGLINFSKGVLSDRLIGRVDVAAYNAGLKRGDNIVIQKQGAFSIRPGFRYIAEALGPDERLFPFQFSDDQPYALAFGQEYLQPMTAGGIIVEEELQIEDIENTDPMRIAALNHGYVAGDQAFIQGVDGDLGDYLNNRVWQVVLVPSDDYFAINLDGVNLPAFTGATGGIERTDPAPVPPAVPPTPPPFVPPDPPPVYGGGNYDFITEDNWKGYAGGGYHY